MKKVLLGLISIILAGQVSFAQPVSDMAVIPMGITIQSIMRLAITKGGNIEFVFKSATDVSNGIPAAFGTQYQTVGTISASQNWDLQLTTDETQFISEDGVAANNLALNVVAYDVSCTQAAALTVSTDLALAQSPATQPLVAAGNNLGSNIGFDFRWVCGNTLTTPAAASIVGSVAGRFTVNVILSLVAN